MRKENWLVLALVDMIRVFGQFIRQRILLYNPLPERPTERVDQSKERWKKGLGRMLKGSWLVVVVLREWSVQPFHLRDNKIGHPHGFSVSEWHCIIVRRTVVLLRGSAEPPTTMRSCFLSSQRFIPERIAGFAEQFPVSLLWTMLIHGEDVAILKLWRVMELRCD